MNLGKGIKVHLPYGKPKNAGVEVWRRLYFPPSNPKEIQGQDAPGIHTVFASQC